MFAHLTAPTLGSSATIALELRRTEALRYNEEAQIRAILRGRGITDGVVEGALLARARARAGAQAGGEEAAASCTSAPTPAASVMDTHPAQPLYDSASRLAPVSSSGGGGRGGGERQQHAQPLLPALRSRSRSAGSVERLATPRAASPGAASPGVGALDMVSWVRGKGPRAEALGSWGGHGGYTPRARSRGSAAGWAGWAGGSDPALPGQDRPYSSARARAGGSQGAGAGAGAGAPLLAYGSRTSAGRGSAGAQEAMDPLATLMYAPVYRTSGRR